MCGGVGVPGERGASPVGLPLGVYGGLGSWEPLLHKHSRVLEIHSIVEDPELKSY